MPLPSVSGASSALNPRTLTTGDPARTAGNETVSQLDGYGRQTYRCWRRCAAQRAARRTRAGWQDPVRGPFGHCSHTPPKSTFCKGLKSPNCCNSDSEVSGVPSSVRLNRRFPSFSVSAPLSRMLSQFNGIFCAKISICSCCLFGLLSASAGHLTASRDYRGRSLCSTSTFTEL